MKARTKKKNPNTSEREGKKEKTIENEKRGRRGAEMGRNCGWKGGCLCGSFALLGLVFCYRTASSLLSHPIKTNEEFLLPNLKNGPCSLLHVQRR
jgi:hypothetical protein